MGYAHELPRRRKRVDGVQQNIANGRQGPEIDWKSFERTRKVMPMNPQISGARMTWGITPKRPRREVLFLMEAEKSKPRWQS